MGMLGKSVMSTVKSAPAADFVTANIAVGSVPEGICFGNGFVWVSNGFATTMSKIDAVTNAVVATINVGSQPGYCFFDGVDKIVMINGTGNFKKIDTTTNAVTTLVVTPLSQQPICFDGVDMWGMSSASNNAIRKVRISDGAVLATTTVGNNPRAVAHDGANSIWCTNSTDNTVSRVLTSGTNIGTVAVGTYPNGICCAGGFVWVGNFVDGTVTKIDASSQAVLATITVGGSPEGITFDGTYVWVANYGSATASKINMATNAVTTLALPASPRSVCSNGFDTVWMANPDANTVTKISTTPAAWRLVDNFTDGDYTSNPAWLEENPGGWSISSGKLTASSPPGRIRTPLPGETGSAIANVGMWALKMDRTSGNAEFNFLGGHLSGFGINPPNPDRFFIRIDGSTLALIRGDGGTCEVCPPTYTTIASVAHVGAAGTVYRIRRQLGGVTTVHVNGVLTLTGTDSSSGGFKTVKCNSSGAATFDDIYYNPSPNAGPSPIG